MAVPSTDDVFTILVKKYACQSKADMVVVPCSNPHNSNHHLLMNTFSAHPVQRAYSMSGSFHLTAKHYHFTYVIYKWNNFSLKLSYFHSDEMEEVFYQCDPEYHRPVLQYCGTSTNGHCYRTQGNFYKVESRCSQQRSHWKRTFKLGFALHKSIQKA